jgi:hypothetical protein
MNLIVSVFAKFVRATAHHATGCEVMGRIIEHFTQR